MPVFEFYTKGKPYSVYFFLSGILLNIMIVKCIHAFVYNTLFCLELLQNDTY